MTTLFSSRLLSSKFFPVLTRRVLVGMKNVDEACGTGHCKALQPVGYSIQCFSAVRINGFLSFAPRRSTIAKRSP